MKKLLIFLCVAVMLLTSCGQDVGIIGGADGPTKIYVADGSEVDTLKMVRIDGNLYYETGRDSDAMYTIGRVSGDILDRTDGSSIPQNESETNFPAYAYIIVDEETVALLEGDDCEEFKKLPDSVDASKYSYALKVEVDSLVDKEYRILANAPYVTKAEIEEAEKGNNDSIYIIAENND